MQCTNCQKWEKLFILFTIIVPNDYSLHRTKSTCCLLYRATNFKQNSLGTAQNLTERHNYLAHLGLWSPGARLLPGVEGTSCSTAQQSSVQTNPWTKSLRVARKERSLSLRSALFFCLLLLHFTACILLLWFRDPFWRGLGLRFLESGSAEHGYCYSSSGLLFAISWSMLSNCNSK